MSYPLTPIKPSFVNSINIDSVSAVLKACAGAAENTGWSGYGFWPPLVSSPIYPLIATIMGSIL